MGEETLSVELPNTGSSTDPYFVDPYTCCSGLNGHLIVSLSIPPLFLALIINLNWLTNLEMAGTVTLKCGLK